MCSLLRTVRQLQVAFSRQVVRTKKLLRALNSVRRVQVPPGEVRP